MADTSLLFSFLADPSGALRGTAAVAAGLDKVSASAESAMAGASAAVERESSGWRQTMSTAGMAAGAAAGAAVLAGVVGAMDRETDVARVQAQLGVSPAAAAGIGDAAGAAYANGFGQSASDNMATAKAIVQAGLADATDSAAVQGAVQQAQTLASTYELDVTQAARAAGTMMKTGMAGSAEEAFDIIYAGLRGTGDLAGDALDTWSEYSTQFRQLGLDGQQSMGLLQQGLQAGARDVDTVADALKEFAIRGQDGSKASAEGFKALGLNAKDMTAKIAAGGPTASAALDTVLDRLRGMKDPVAQNAAAVAMFGTKAEDLGQALFALDPSSAVGALGQVQGSVDAAGAAMQETSAAKAQRFKASIQEALVDTMSAALPVVTKVTDFLGKHEGALSKVVPVLLAVGAAIAVVSLAQSAWAVVQGVQTVATGVATAAQWLWNVAMSANPIGLIIIGVMLLVGVFILLWNKCDWFRNFWIGLWDGIKAAAGAVADWFSGPFVDFFKAAWDFIVLAATLWWDVFSGFWKTIGGWFVSLFQGWWSLFTGFWSGVFSAVGAAWDWIVGKWNAMVTFVTGLPGKIGAAAAGMWNGIKDAFRGAINWIIDRWNGLSFSVPSIDVPLLGRVGGFTLSTPNIPHLNMGGVATGSGWARVGDRGPEDVFLPRAAQVRPLSLADRSARSTGRTEVVVRYVGDAAAIAFLRRLVRVEGGGDVQVAFG